MSVFNSFNPFDVAWIVLRILLLGFLILVCFKVFPILISPYTSPLRFIPGPPNPSWLYGHLRAIFNAQASELHEKWTQEYGKTIRYKGFFNVSSDIPSRLHLSL